MGASETRLSDCEAEPSEPRPRGSVFYCEEAAQKAIKSLLPHRTSQKPPKVHNRVELGRPAHVDQTMLDFPAELTPHYMIMRYPDAAGAVTSGLYDGRLSLRFPHDTKKVTEWCRRRLR